MVIRWALKPIVARSRGVVKMHTQTISVSPALAVEWLKKNTFNRKLSKLVIQKYASDMSQGDWTLTHQGIAFDTDGVLADGQHRLHAVIESGVTVPMMVTWGVQRKGIDELRPRRAIDAINFAGLSDWIVTKDIEVIRAMIEIGQGGKKSAATTSQIIEFANDHRVAIEFVREKFTRNTKGLTTAMVKASFAVAYYHHDKDILSRMISSLLSGMIGGTKESAVIRLREALLTNTTNGMQARIDNCKRTMRAIQLYAAGDECKRLILPKGFIYDLPETKSTAQ